MIYLIRHGITVDNEKKLYSGHTDSELSDKGIKALKQLRHLYKDELKIVSSPLKRCVQTSTILFGRSPDKLENDLKEMNFGIFEGKSYEEIKDLEEYQHWLKHYIEVGPPNGESFIEFKQRVLDVFNQIDNCVVITHGGVIRLVLCEFFELNFFEIEIPNGLGYIIDKENKTYKLIRGN